MPTGVYVRTKPVWNKGWRKKKDIPEKHKCSCKEECKALTYRIYAPGHNPQKKREKKPLSPPQICDCKKCGLMTKPGNRFIHGHQAVGVKRSEETRELQRINNLGPGNPQFGKPVSKKCSEVNRERMLNGGADILNAIQAELMKDPVYRENQCRIKKESMNRPEVKEKLSRENSYMWRGGISFEPYGPEFNDELKERIRNRDQHKCRICGRLEKDNNGYLLSIHHIDYDKNNNDDKNLISLCLICHAKTNFTREDWIRYFNDMNKEIQDKTTISKTPEIPENSYICNKLEFHIDTEFIN